MYVDPDLISLHPQIGLRTPNHWLSCGIARAQVDLHAYLHTPCMQPALEEARHGACLSVYTPTSSELDSYLCSPLCHVVGEQVLANATKVTRLLPLVRDNPVAAVDGGMVCSNYRLQFIPDKKSIAGDINEETLNDSQSIPLLSILSVIKGGLAGACEIVVCVCVCVHVIQRVIGSCDRLLCDKMFECTSPVNVGFCD